MKFSLNQPAIELTSKCQMYRLEEGRFSALVVTDNNIQIGI